jgi:ribosomal subunit interface protein
MLRDLATGGGGQVDIVVKGRRMDVSDRFRTHAVEKLTKVEKLDPGMQRVDVEVSKEPNPRLSDRAYRVELTCRSRGPVIRAEAAAEDKLSALDLAMGRLESRLRRASDRRADRKKHVKSGAVVAGDGRGEVAPAQAEGSDPWAVPDDGPMVVREKTHEAEPMSLDQALYEMELVGHDFFLFVDAASKRPSVVYRRHAYHYGVIRLSVDGVGGSAG